MPIWTSSSTSSSYSKLKTLFRPHMIWAISSIYKLYKQTTWFKDDGYYIVPFFVKNELSIDWEAFDPGFSSWTNNKHETLLQANFSSATNCIPYTVYAFLGGTQVMDWKQYPVHSINSMVQKLSDSFRSANESKQSLLYIINYMTCFVNDINYIIFLTWKIVLRWNNVWENW